MTPAAIRIADLAQSIRARLERLAIAADGHFDVDAARARWADAEMLGEIDRRLRELSDQLFAEGEYRPGNVTR